ncbi:MAG: hypothetical protein QW572_01590 [Candidatus Nitrosocaldus sp.]
MQHVQVVHNSNTPYWCVECNLGFSDGNELREHAKRYHTYRRK